MRDQFSIGRKALLGALLISSAVIVAAAAWELRASQHGFSAVSQDLLSARQITADMKRLREKPKIAALGVDTPQQISERISIALRQAEIASTALLSVAPGKTDRIPDSPYRVRETELMLHGVALERLVGFTTSLESVGEGWVVRDLILTPSNAQLANASSAAELWNVRLILTQIIYSPTSP